MFMLIFVNNSIIYSVHSETKLQFWRDKDYKFLISLAIYEQNHFAGINGHL